MRKRDIYKYALVTMVASALFGCATNRADVKPLNLNEMSSVISEENQSSKEDISLDKSSVGDSEKMLSDEEDNAILDEAVPTASEPEKNAAGKMGAVSNPSDVKKSYEKFLANEEPVIIESYRLFGDLHSAFFNYEEKDGQAYLLSEIIHRILAEDNELNVKAIKYAYIDSMDKGSEQLLVSITTDWGDEEFSSGQNYTDYKFVVNNVEGQLKLLYENEEVFRYAVTINKYGYISTGTYSGFASDEYEYRILTEDGWNFVYGETFEAGNCLTPLKLFWDWEPVEVNLESLCEDGGAVWSYRFEEEGDANMTYSYAFWNDEGGPEYGPSVEEKLYGKNSPYRKAFEDAGVTIYTMSEVGDMISKREKELGITNKITDADEPEWNEIKDISAIIDAANKKTVSKAADNKIIDIDSNILKYRNIRYSDFVNMTGNEAEFYHNCYFISSIPDSSYEIVFLGGWNDNTFEAYLDDDSVGYMLQGKLKDFVNSDRSEIALDKIIEDLGVVSYEYREGGGTIYYVSDNYVRLNIDTGSDGKADMFMDVDIDPNRANVIKLDSCVYLYWNEEPM
ncbi:hypothetical protein [Butyrivibrio sp. AE3004]|uniref:hypothetical protein n=1 Tax=Butyrivibrio sp. AE3004 TaxID=1506994 RepID=UPI0004946CFB|nr:hypothetical protein [Butyrivibrio sp. AE3004]